MYYALGTPGLPRWDKVEYETWRKIEGTYFDITADIAYADKPSTRVSMYLSETLGVLEGSGELLVGHQTGEVCGPTYSINKSCEVWRYLGMEGGLV